MQAANVKLAEPGRLRPADRQLKVFEKTGPIQVGLQTQRSLQIVAVIVARAAGRCRKAATPDPQGPEWGMKTRSRGQCRTAGVGLESGPWLSMIDKGGF
jgi:hypothetical protein